MTFLASARLRHRGTIKYPVDTINAEGRQVQTWQTLATDVAMEIAPLSAREFVAAQSEQSKVTHKITLRWRSDLRATMRIERTMRGVTTVYAIEGVIPDNKSGLEWITLPVSSGVINA